MTQLDESLEDSRLIFQKKDLLSEEDKLRKYQEKLQQSFLVIENEMQKISSVLNEVRYSFWGSPSSLYSVLPPASLRLHLLISPLTHKCYFY